MASSMTWSPVDNCTKLYPDYGGNWTRESSDPGAYLRAIKQSTDVLGWKLDPTYAEREMPCRAGDSGFISKQGVSFDTTRPLVDTESELKRLKIYNSKDPNVEYKPCCPNCKNCDDGFPCGGGVTSGCENCQPELFHFPVCRIKNEFTRISNPSCNFRGTGGPNRFTHLFLNPQDRTRWELQGEVGIHNRLVVKDNHVPCIPRPLDPCMTLPDAQATLPCEWTTPVCAAHIKPMHPYQLN